VSAKDNGGPAFPGTAQKETPRPELGEGGYAVTFHPVSGMTLRDYFAAKAMQGGLAGRATNSNKLDVFAAECYSVADAMLKERAK
jgi:hypothetical protein